MTESNHRLARPHNTTLPAQNKKTNKKRLKYIEDKYIREYLENDYMSLGIRMSLETFCSTYSIKMKRLQDEMILRASNIEANMEGKGMEGTLRAIISELFRGTLADRASALQQQSLLLSAQGGSYRPFISGEVNHGMKNLFQANDQILKTLKTLLPTNGLESLNKTPEGLARASSGLTHNRALEIIAEVSPKTLLEDPKAIEALEDKYNLLQLPEVVADRQKGYNSSNEGLNFKDIEKVQMEAFSKQNEGHLDRRAEEENIDTEELI